MKCRSIPVLEQPFAPTPIVKLAGQYSDNEIWMKRDDLLPFSFGGNKARKAWQFYQEIRRDQPDVIMTYGSNASNHCRIIANMAVSMGLPCHIIANDHEVKGKGGRKLFNRLLVEQFGASVETVRTEQVHNTIETRLADFRAQGKKPYFIQGGGHGNTGTAAYYETYREILDQQKALGERFAYIFHASGTGATQGGLVAGRIMVESQPDLPEIVGISIARRNPRGRDVVRESVLDYLAALSQKSAAGRNLTQRYEERYLTFDDSYIQGGYGEYTPEVPRTIARVMEREGIPMDTTYVGKAFVGMLHWLEDHGIHGQQILFIHTGGTPLYFDML